MKLPPMAVGFLLLALACESATGPAATLVVTTPPLFSGVVTSKAHYSRSQTCPELASQCPGWVSYYGLWAQAAPSAAPSADSIPIWVFDSVPVFVRNRFGLARTTASRIRTHDRIEIWGDYYQATQVLIVQ